MAQATELEVEGKKIKVTNLEKVLFPKISFTKGHLIDYYIQISKFLLPHLKDRPLTLKRFPDGIEGESFYEKNAPSFTPKWVKTVKVRRVSGESDINYIVVNDLPTLVWTANLANIELHTLLARAPRIERPTMLVFDLDPGEPAGVIECARVALWLKEVLDGLGLKSFVKSSGSKGLHFYVPLNTAVSYDSTQPAAQALAQLLEKRHPELVVSAMAKRLRSGKVFIDWSQNSAHKTTVSVYSLRAKNEQPFVSIPLEWAEVEKALAGVDRQRFFVGPEEAMRRCQKLGDLFEPVLSLKQKLPKRLVEAVQALETQPVKRQKPAAKRDLSLAGYKAKRDFTQTQEPPPQVKRRNTQEKERLFVIQKHQARNLHYDFRLEMDGVLKSWAVPKGPPYERAEKHLAMQVEDHPLDYARFEGTIPAGNYGAGTVMVWDIGTYDVIDGNLPSGKLHLVLHGKKLKGEWIVVRARGGQEEAKHPWFLIKGGTTMKRPSAKRDDSSALSGRSMAQIAKANDAQWLSDKSSHSSTAAG